MGDGTVTGFATSGQLFTGTILVPDPAKAAIQWTLTCTTLGSTVVKKGMAFAHRNEQHHWVLTTGSFGPDGAMAGDFTQQ